MKTLLILGLIFFNLLSFGQSRLSQKQIERRNYQEVIGNYDETKELSKPEKYAMYPNGVKGVHNHILRNLRYPELASANNIQGTVILRFIVEADGEISEIEVVQSVHKLLDDEAIRVVKKFKPWIPGYKNGEPVRVQYNFPFVFRL